KTVIKYYSTGRHGYDRMNNNGSNFVYVLLICSLNEKSRFAKYNATAFFFLVMFAHLSLVLWLSRFYLIVKMDVIFLHYRYIATLSKILMLLDWIGQPYLILPISLKKHEKHLCHVSDWPRKLRNKYSRTYAVLFIYLIVNNQSETLAVSINVHIYAGKQAVLHAS
ncbi:hypothetical protein ACJX0J_031987, partial [Zea mays]